MVAFGGNIFTSLVSRRSGAPITLAASILALVGLGGCPDPQKSFDDFVKRAPTRDGGGGGGGTLEDISGTFLLAVSTVLAPDAPIQFITDSKLTPNGDGTAKLDMTLTPLTVMGRTKVGTPIVVKGAAIDENGAFTIDLMTQTVPGAANPVSGSDIEAKLVLKGAIRSKDRFCGDIEGELVKPYVSPLAGSTWSGIRVPEGTIGDKLPKPEGSCPAPAPDGGTGDGG